MEKLKLFMIMLVLGGLGLVGCDDNDPEGPEISATTFVAGSEPGTAELRVPEGAEVVYRPWTRIARTRFMSRTSIGISRRLG